MLFRRRELLGMNINESSISADKKHYYSSSQGPFHNANNILMFFGGGGRGEVVETIIRSLRMGDPIITVCGERGSGKTMLSLVLADRLKHRYNIIRYDHPQLTAALMLRHLLIEVCPPDAELISANSAVDGVGVDVLSAGAQRLTAALGNGSPGDKPYLLFVDTSVDLDKQTLQLLHDLIEAQPQQNPPLQIILFRRADGHGQNHQIAGYTDANTMEDHYVLRRLSLSEITEYLRHHMMLFDFNRRDAFTREMAYFIADRSEGLFRSINTLSRNAFMLASLEDAESVSMSHLLTAGLPSREPEMLKQNFVVRHRAGLVSLLGCSVLGALTLVLFF